MKKGFVAVLIATLLLTLVGCGSSGGGSGETDPNAGVYTMASAEMFGMELSADEIFDSVVTIELLSGGKAKLAKDGSTGNLSWTLTGDQIELTGGGVSLSGTLANGVLKIENWMDMGLDITFVCEEIAGSQTGGQTETSGNQQSIYGYYDAVAYSVDLTEEGTFYLEQGESLTLNEDGSIDMVLEGEDCHYDTILEDNEFFYNDTSVGAITEDGLIYIDLNEACRYVFAREGHPAWEAWKEYISE
ncbi:MAG: hypothetical protein MJ086_05615 [Lachnospiraceae bacterium]|nr:hypothetical protein [Lachnospiraceae bacterium]